MAFATVQSWSETAGSNTEIDGTNIDEGCNASGINNAIRELMSQVASWTGDDTIASATTTDLSTVNGQFVSITGTTTITGLGTVKAGWSKFVRFSGALTLTHNATSLILPGAANITTAAGDTALFISEGSGNWRCHAYQRAAGLYANTATANTWTAAQTFDGGQNIIEAADNVATTYPLLVRNSAGTQSTSFGAYGMAMTAGTRQYTILAHDNITTTYPIEFSNSAGTQTAGFGAYGASITGSYTFAATGAYLFSAPVRIPDGTVSAPGLAASSNTDTGIYFSGGGLRFTHDGGDIASVGSTGITVNTTPGSGTFGVNDAVKLLINSGGQIDVTNTTGGSCLRMSRTTNGQIQQFYQSTTQVGNISVTGSATAYNTSSDERLKPLATRAPLEQDTDLDAVWEAIEPLAYNMVDHWSMLEVEGRCHGMLAQQLHKVYPQAVTPGEGKPGDEDFIPWSIDYSKLVPLMIARQKQFERRTNARLDALEL